MPRLGHKKAQTAQRIFLPCLSLRPLRLFVASSSVSIRVHPWLKTGLRTAAVCCLAVGTALPVWSQQPAGTNAPWVAQIVHSVKDTATLEMLRAALKEPDPAVRELALEALTLIRDPADAAKARVLLDSDNEFTRQQAAKSTASLGGSLSPAQRVEELRVRPVSKSPAPALSEGLRSTNLLHLVRALQILDAEGARREGKALIGLLGRPEAVVQEAAVRAVQRGQVTAASGDLFKLLDDPDEGLRLASGEALAAMFDQVPRPELMAAMIRRLELDPSSQVRRVAGLTLVVLHDPPARDALLRLLKHERGVTRVSAAQALGVWGDTELAAVLHPLLSDPADLVARAASHSLGQLRNQSSKGPLLAAFEARGPVVQERAAWALGELKSTNAITALAERLKTTDEALKVSLVLALGKTGDKRALPPIRQVLQQIVLANNLPRAREAAFTALTAAGDKVAIPRAILMVNTPVVPPAPGAGPTYDEDYVRIAALNYLAAVGDKAAGTNLLAGLKEAVFREMRPTVAETLSRLLGKNYQPVADEDHRRYFMESLGLRANKPVPATGVVLTPP